MWTRECHLSAQTRRLRACHLPAQTRRLRAHCTAGGSAALLPALWCPANNMMSSAPSSLLLQWPDHGKYRPHWRRRTAAIGLLLHLLQLVACNGHEGRHVNRVGRGGCEVEEAIHAQALLHRLGRHARAVAAVNIVLYFSK